MEHRGTARRRFVSVKGTAELPTAGTAIMAGDKTLGTLGSSAGSIGLALIRLDRAKEAINARVPIKAGDTVIDVTLPSWATYDWPAPSVDSA
jgi:folate-binding Fe-S cluster repair protein YgfZ